MFFHDYLEVILRHTLFFLVRHLSQAICTRCRPARCFRFRPDAGGEVDEADTLSGIRNVEVWKLDVGLRFEVIGCIRLPRLL
jgi:hypothetical protein